MSNNFADIAYWYGFPVVQRRLRGTFSARARSRLPVRAADHALDAKVLDCQAPHIGLRSSLCASAMEQLIAANCVKKHRFDRLNGILAEFSAEVVGSHAAPGISGAGAD